MPHEADVKMNGIERVEKDESLDESPDLVDIGNVLGWRKSNQMQGRHAKTT